MKIIHCADLHLNSKMQTLLDLQKASIRKSELINNFERLVNFASNNDCKIILIAGDLFDTNNVSKMCLNAIVNIIKNNSHIEFLYLNGNHDSKEIFKDIMLPNLKTFGEDIISYDYGNFRISGMNLTQQNCENFYDKIKLDNNKKNIFTLHGQISKYEQDEITINLTKLQNKNIDYLALGHIHSYYEEMLEDKTRVVYSGCLEGRGFDEFGQKGFVLLDVNEDINYKFIPFAKREFVNIQFDITGYNDWFKIKEDLMKKIANVKSENIVEIVFVGTFKDNLEKHLNLIDLELKDRFFAYRIKDNSVLEINVENYKNDISLKGEFVSIVYKDEKLTQKQKEDIIILGLKALKGDEI